RYPDPAKMIERAQDAGLRVAAWSSPYIEQAAGPFFDDAKSKGYFPPMPGLLLNHWGPPIDFTNKSAYAFWQAQIEQLRSLGVEGFKLDYGEDIVAGVSGGRTPWLFGDQSDERTMHYGYTLLYHEVYAKKLEPADGGFLLCRAGRWSDQTHAMIIWPGDLDAT